MTSRRWQAAAAAATVYLLAACGGGGTSNPLKMTMFAPLVAEATSPAGATVAVPSPTLTGAVGAASVSCTPAIGPGPEPIGTTTVNCSASDAAGNLASGSSTITVADTTAPALVMFAPISVAATGPSGAVVTVPVPAASDLASTPSLACSPGTGPVQFAIGTTPVSCTARDGAGNTTTRTSSVTVRPPAAGPSGSLDPAFATGGIYIMPTLSLARAVLVQGDGKPVVLVQGPFTSGNSFRLLRFNADGSLDSSFGVGGQAAGNLGGFVASGEEANSLVLQPDGKLVVGGWGSTLVNGVGTTPFALTRFDADGTLDTSFGNGGKALITFSGGAGGFMNALAIQADGKLVAAGSTTGAHNHFNFALARVLANGTLDTGFGSGGTVVTDFSASENDNAVQSVALQSDGRIVAAGWNQLGGSGSDIAPALMRYNADGSVDTAFGAQGRVSNETLIDNSNGPATVAVQPDGRIVLSMGVDTRLEDFALSRYNADGTPDTSFGAAGVVTTDFGLSSQDQSYAMVLQADGKIVVGGFTSSPKGSLFALARYRADGSLDPAFGTGGRVASEIGVAFSLESIRALAVQPDGGIVAVGEVSDSNAQAAIARYLP